ncbi:MAG TPA: TolC family protein, partial [Vicinamibacterales bacterium]
MALLRPSFADAQEHTVEKLVAIAIERAPELRAARAAIAVAGAQVTQAGLRPNPMVIADQAWPTDDMTSTMVGVEWPLNLFRRPARIEAARR